MDSIFGCFGSKYPFFMAFFEKKNTTISVREWEDGRETIYLNDMVCLRIKCWWNLKAKAYFLIHRPAAAQHEKRGG